MKDIEQAIAQMTEEVYLRLVSAVELGRWQDGQPLTQEQKASTLQLVMLYQAKRQNLDEHLTVGADGRINEWSKAKFKQAFKGDTIASFDEKSL
ncbi:hypothetical protein NFHSH190041_16200 [Shewanella sp. NFH-SH190041]|uniref:YeaC family protein n=1 Tax=Shewanella sp. NFH-SH190041 TaxID=2950245 RepID=UPI0021C3D67C|nr:DUF1315 family protein [Shewanella sp. NFH-SH190041]BDM64168.1 hypothetical protein NFHSH190041_16200 [Shewanella sp. NFH-SH190041]